MNALHAVLWDVELPTQEGSDPGPARDRRANLQDAVGAWVRRVRMEQGISVRALAERAGVSTSFISQIENAIVSPSIASLERICDALGATVAECLSAAGESEAGLIVRSTGRREVSSSWSRAQVEALAAVRSGRLEPLLITLDPGGQSAEQPSAHATDEFVFVLLGRPTLTLGPQRHELRASDAVTIRACEKRRWENRTESVVKILCVSAR